MLRLVSYADWQQTLELSAGQPRELGTITASTWKRGRSCSLGELPSEYQLQRNRPVEAFLPRLVYDSHPSTGNLLQQLVVTEVANVIAD